MKKIKEVFMKIKSYINENNAEIISLLITWLAISILSGLPYFNIFFSLETKLLILLISAIIILKIKEKFIFYCAIFLLFLAPIFLYFKYIQLVEILGNFAYYLLLIGLIKSLIIYFREIKK